MATPWPSEVTRRSDGITSRGLEQAHLAKDRHRIGVYVLALDLPVLKGNDVTPLPLDASARGLGDDVAPGQRLLVRRPRRPFLDYQVLADVEPPGFEGDVGPRLEYPRDVLERILAFGSLARGVVLKDHVERVHRPDALDVVGVPRLVVGGDDLVELLRRDGHAHSIGSYPLERGAETIKTVAISSPSLRTVRRCSGSSRAKVPAVVGRSSPSITSVGVPLTA